MIKTGLSMVRITAGVKGLSHYQDVLTVSGSQPASCAMDTERFFRGGIAAGSCGWLLTFL